MKPDGFTSSLIIPFYFQLILNKKKNNKLQFNKTYDLY